MLKRLAIRARDESGWSMPEVLTVMMIIGILIGISGGGFNGCQGQPARSADVAAKSVARTAAAAMEAYANDNLGAYDGATATVLNGINSSVPTNMEVLGYANCTGGTGSDTCYSVRTPDSLTPTTNRFQLVKKVDGKLQSLCTTEGTGACPVGGKWSAE